MEFSSSGDGQREGDRELSSHSQSSTAFSIPGSNSKTEWAGSQENTLDEDIKQYTRIQILSPENIQPPPQQQRKSQEGDFGKHLEKEGARTDELRSERVNMGSQPTPTPIEEKRRSVSGIPRESQPPKSQLVKPRPYFKHEPPRATYLASVASTSWITASRSCVKEKTVVRHYLAMSPAEERARALFVSTDPVREKERKEQRDLLVRQQLHEAKERDAKMREQVIRRRLLESE